jgi:pimeloyl-ACP methyl ester carboxylesterase
LAGLPPDAGPTGRNRSAQRPLWRNLLISVGAVLALLASTFAAGAPAQAHPRPPDRRPVIFVHGFVGSGGQFETQALRFASNGYSPDLIEALDYDSLFGVKPMEEVWNDLDAMIDRKLEESGADQVDLLGHSLGTRVSQGYLNSSPERAARVAHYINLDGFPGAAPPGGVPTLAVWGEGLEDVNFGGAENVHLSDQSHVQIASSAETFDAVYRFINDRPPRTTKIVPQWFITVAGRAILFPSNVGAEGATLQVWEVDGRTGMRRHRRPKATFTLGPDGAFGPFRASTFKHYEFAIVRDGQTHHFYMERFVRSDHLVRLLTQEPGTGLDLLREKSDTTTTMTLVRYKEFWGDQAADANDVLTIDGQNILTPPIAPRSKRLIGLFAFDAGLDGVTDLSAPIPTFVGLPFLSGADVNMVATTPPDRSIELRVEPRGDERTVNAVNVPNWASTSHHVSIHLRDFTDAEVWHFGRR